MSIVKNLIVPAIGLSFLLGGALAFAQGDGWGDSKDQSATDQSATDQSATDQGTTEQGWGETYLIGDHQEQKDKSAPATLQLVGGGDGKTTTPTDHRDSDSDWLV